MSKGKIRGTLSGLEKRLPRPRTYWFIQFDDDLIDTPAGSLTLDEARERYPGCIVTRIAGVIEDDEEYEAVEP